MSLTFKAALATAALAALCACSNTKTNQAVTTETPNGTPATSPSGQETAAQKKALVRFVDAIPGQSNMDLWFGDMKVFSNVAYKNVTPYMEVPAERHDFKLEPAGNTQTTAPATNSEGLSGGGHYTVIAQRKDGKLNLNVVNDNFSAPSSGKAKVRVINATQAIGKIDVVGPSGNLVTGVSADSSSSYDNVDPAQGLLEVRRADKHNDIARAQNFTIDAGKFYTIIVMGGAGQRVDVIPVTDELTPQGTPTGD